MGLPIQHIVGFDGQTYDLPTGGGGLRRLTFTWDGTAGTLKDYDTGETVTLNKDELFLFMGRSWGSNLPDINSIAVVGSQWYGTTISFSAKCANVPERISGTPNSWYLFLPVGKSCLAYYSHSDSEISILEDQYLICEMSSAQLSDFANFGIKYKDSGATWTDFTPTTGYYTRSKVFLQRSASISGVTDLCIGAAVGGSSLDSSLVITGAYVMSRDILYGGITKVYKTIGDGEDSQGCPAYKLCMTSGNEPPYIHGIIIEDACSIIMN